MVDPFQAAPCFKVRQNFGYCILGGVEVMLQQTDLGQAGHRLAAQVGLFHVLS